MQSKQNLTKTTYRIAKMDCSAEEQMVRMKLESLSNIKKLDFDLTKKTLFIIHSSNNNEITKYLEELKLDLSLTQTEPVEESNSIIDEEANRSKLLWMVLIINFAFFCSRNDNRFDFRIDGACCGFIRYVR